MYGVKLAGLGKAIPEKVLTNDDLSQMVDTSDEWIQTRTGIKKRHIATSETTTSLATQAGKEAIDNSNLTVNDIDLVIVATVSADKSMPSTACELAENLGIEHAVCFDISAACSGFIFASEIASNFIKLGSYKNALVIGAETLSRLVDWQDRGTCILFADGAGAAVYSQVPKDQDKVLGYVNKSGGGSQVITCTNIAHSNLFSKEKEEDKFLKMNGQAVYKFATTEVPKLINELLEQNSLMADDIDWYVLHQANARIIDSVAKKLKQEDGKFYKNVEDYGNTSAASIPIALYDAQKQFKKNDKIVLSGFGAGLTWGSMVFIWD